MRRLIKYAILSAAALLFAGCEVDLNPDTGDAPEKECIVLRLGSAPLSVTTKAGSERGNNYNESLIESVDLFFYPEGGTDNNAVMTAIGRSVEAKNEADSTVYLVKIHYTAAQAASLFGSTTGGTCQVFAIANANINYGSDTKVESLKELTIERDFSMTETQNSFVMSSEALATVTQALDGSGDPYATGRIHMKRAAAKAQLFLRFPEYIEDSNDPNTRHWKPDLDGTHGSAGVYVDLMNISKKGRIDAAYTVQDADYTNSLEHHASPRASLPAFYPAIDASYDAYTYAATPFYTYPISWSDLDEHACSYIIHIPWYPEDYNSSTDTFEPKPNSAGYRTYQVNANVVGLKMERNHCYRTFVYIQTLGGVDKDQIAVIPECDYYICPWNFESTTGNGIVAGSFADYKYLVVDNPEMTINNEEDAVFTYVSSSSISKVKIDSVVFYINQKPSPKDGMKFGASYSSTGGTYTAAQGGEITSDTGSLNCTRRVTVSGTNYDVNVKIDADKSVPGVVKLSHSLTNVYCQWEVYATITNGDNISEQVHFVQNPPIRLERSSKANDLFINGYFSWVKNATFGTRFGTIHGNDFSDYWHSTRNFVDLRWSNGRYTGGYHTNAGTGGYGSLFTEPAMAGTTITEIFTTEINISSFNSTNNTYTAGGDPIEYKIGDPRVKASENYSDFSLNNYLKGESGATDITDSWESPGDIMLCSRNEEDRSIIAPRFLVSSGMTELLVGQIPTEFINFEKRAATYQEAGYPAGRWRLPTEAEVAFIAARQSDGTIPDIFNRDVPYYCASGRWVIIPTTGDLQFGVDTDYQITVWGSRYYIYELLDAKFVYDLWYWGDETSTTNVYHPNGHVYNYDSSGNATAR